jgi:hypothetical protein
MSGMSPVSGADTAFLARQQDMFAKGDADKSGTLGESEFAFASPSCS